MGAPKRRSSAETASRFLAMYRPNTRVQRWRDMKRRRACSTCGGGKFADAIDNHGRHYKGCVNCRVVDIAIAQQRDPTTRIQMDFARATVKECLDCVSARINEAHARGEEPEHITNIAWQMLNDALQGKP